MAKKMQVFGLRGGSGYDGIGISSIDQTTTSGKDGGLNVITFTLTDGSTYEATLRNGTSGVDGIGISSISIEEVTNTETA